MVSSPEFKFDHVHIISKDPEASANWYVDMFGAKIAANTMARGAAQIFVELGGTTILIRGQRPGEDPAAARPVRPYADFSSHNTWGPIISASSTRVISRHFAPSCAAKASVSLSS
jgi:catechol 2,3-dioxygenase-like lactoylglutathione lyase family enzyme